MMKYQTKQKTPLSNIGLLALSLVGLFLTIYIIFQISWIVRGPIITIDTPKKGESLPTGVITLVGSAKRSVIIYINGLQTPIDTHGMFALDTVIMPGLNTITVKAVNRYHKESYKSIMVWGKVKTPTPLEVSVLPEPVLTN